MISNLTSKLVFVRTGVDEIRRNTTMNIQRSNNGGSFMQMDPSIAKDQDKSVIETVLLSDVIEAIGL